MMTERCFDSQATLSFLIIQMLEMVKYTFLCFKYKTSRGLVLCHHAPIILPGRVAQSVTCLTADPGVASSIPARSHTFVEIDHEIISTIILLPSAESFKKGCCQLQAEVCARSTG